MPTQIVIGQRSSCVHVQFDTSGEKKPTALSLHENLLVSFIYSCKMTLVPFSFGFKPVSRQKPKTEQGRSNFQQHLFECRYYDDMLMIQLLPSGGLLLCLQHVNSGSHCPQGRQQLKFIIKKKKSKLKFKFAHPLIHLFV